MTREEKQILLKDLCARLLHGFIVHRYSDNCDISIDSVDDFAHFLEYSEDDEFKPYLRPMSSMNEEELKEFRACHCVYDLHPDFQPMMCNIENELNMFNWLDVHHFDYRGLIEKGLALEALEGMYKTE